MTAVSSIASPATPPVSSSAAADHGSDHPALAYFVQAQRHLADGDLEAAAEQTQLADASLQAVPIADPQTHQALVKAHALVLEMAQHQAQGLRGQLRQNGAARRAVAQYGR